MAVALGTVDTIRGADFQTRHLLLALDAGEPYRIARALTMEAAYVATAGGPAQARAPKLLEVGRELAERIEHPHAIGWSRLAAGFCAFLSGRWRDARPWFTEAESIFRERCSGCAWELDSVDLFSLWTRYYLGELGELGRLLPSRVQEAAARGDRYGVTNLRARVAHVIALAGDDPAAAEREAKEAVAAWSHHGFHAQHYYQLFAQAEADLYRGDAAAAADDRGRALAGAAQVAAAAGAVHPPRGAASARAHAAGGGALRRRRRPRRACRRRSPTRGASSARACRGPRRSARWCAPARRRSATTRRGRPSLCELAARELDAAGMALYATVARWRLGHLLGGGDGYALVTAANEWMQHAAGARAATAGGGAGARASRR